jgi:ribosomal-protein-serine acetyltransferase
MLSLPLAEGAELRALEPWHAADLAEHFDRSRAHLARWLSLAERIVDEDSARAYIQAYADRAARDDGRLYGIWVDGDLRGGTLFRVWNTVMGTCEVGVWLDPDVTGRGLVTRAVTHMIDWAVCVRGMSRVEWQAASNNERSIAVAQRLGMSRDGVLRQATVINGTRLDVDVWSVLAGEWRDRTVESCRDRQG